MSNIDSRIPDLLQKFPSVGAVLDNVGTNELNLQSSEKLKQDFKTLNYWTPTGIVIYLVHCPHLALKM